jgi:hypothetical protein
LLSLPSSLAGRWWAFFFALACPKSNHQFAQKFLSDEGQEDGLYWPVAEGQQPSPLAHLADVAKALGYSRSDQPRPFVGYYYKMLTQQGDAAKGGAKDYLVNGKMTGGFAVVAWPAKYKDSGIMTFIVGKDGMIYEKDLGEKTSEQVAALQPPPGAAIPTGTPFTSTSHQTTTMAKQCTRSRSLMFLSMPSGRSLSITQRATSSPTP